MREGLAVDLELLGGGQRCRDPHRLERGDEGARHSRVDLHRADIEAVAAAPLDEMLARAVIAGRRGAAGIVRAQTPAAMPAAGKALQERAALSHGAAHLVRPGPRVLGDAPLVGLIGLPVDVASMMLLDQHLPFLARQLPDALLAHASCVERHFRARLAIDIGPGIDRVRQNLVDSVIARLHPADLGMGVHLQRQLEALIAKPQPHAAGGTHLGKTVEDGADRGDDGLVGMEQHLAVRLAPDEARPAGHAATLRAPPCCGCRR